jgi:hypothetical protein
MSLDIANTAKYMYACFVPSASMYWLPGFFVVGFDYFPKAMSLCRRWTKTLIWSYSLKSS